MKDTIEDQLTLPLQGFTGLQEQMNIEMLSLEAQPNKLYQFEIPYLAAELHARQYIQVGERR